MGRPTGSTSGRRPIGGYPPVSSDVGAFLAGFLEGEATFGIHRQSGGRNHRCTMGLVARSDDAELIHELAERTRLGTVGERAPTGRSRAQVSWTVGANSDCLRLIEILNDYPLRGRKSLDYAVWSAAAQWWTSSDPTQTVRNRDWAPMIYLADRLKRGRQFNRHDGLAVFRDADKRSLYCDWGNYLAGLFTAEGSLGIYKSGQTFAPCASIALRADDEPLLNQIHARVRAGRLYQELRAPVGADRSPAVSWQVR